MPSPVPTRIFVSMSRSFTEPSFTVQSSRSPAWNFLWSDRYHLPFQNIPGNRKGVKVQTSFNLSVDVRSNPAGSKAGSRSINVIVTVMAVIRPLIRMWANSCRRIAVALCAVMAGDPRKVRCISP
jgi:hypothetical protein